MPFIPLTSSNPYKETAFTVGKIKNSGANKNIAAGLAYINHQ
jgi:hypothetical protein